MPNRKSKFSEVIGFGSESIPVVSLCFEGFRMFGDTTSEQSPSHKDEDDEQAKTFCELPMQGAEMGNICTRVPFEPCGYFCAKAALLKLTLCSKL